MTWQILVRDEIVTANCEPEGSFSATDLSTSSAIADAWLNLRWHEPLANKVGVDCGVIRGGAAGLFCALTTSQHGRKVLISGGGSCNFSNLHIDPENYISSNPHFVKSALSSYTQWDFFTLVETHGIAYHEKTLGQLFCDKSPKQILGILLTECEEAGINIQMHCQIKSVEQLSDG